ncbi:raffinose/stachyose/melibiose transport system substrate-binding protein [Butyrivibrio proteoclasticus]|uniref:Raffinose/stachyose/melibiose transport system substrate-binding protein n=1 Tax=Butyrivibrio proteoclasticus TaxID=43305 RepID=A0A1I5UUJ2_9FIRM|nr:ABC transporter substrate-binding protein [Butyrivibrio proteoclasticus]SFP98913.1 raffinose/stachyose/melibiose transport system substrate-binding protein [Butyrivibrio proteoclasticus]
MKKKLMSVLLAGSMVLSLAACGETAADTTTSSDNAEAQTETQTETQSADTTETAAATSEVAGTQEAVRLLNGKPEINDQMQALAAKYLEETGNVLTVETIGGDTNASDELKKMYQADNMPDIFVIEANQAANWDGMLADLSGEEWTNKTGFELVDSTMGTIGFPYTVEATALGYNADILAKAGIDPSTLTSPDAWKAACETLDSKKDELGITAVFGWCAEPTNLGWSSGTHVFGQYLDAGLKADDTTYIDLLNDGGKIDEARMKNFAEFIGMMNQYSDPALLVDGTYDNQVAGFKEGKYVFITQGNWCITSPADVNFECGFAPYAFEDGINTIIAGPPSYWVAYSNGNVEGAKAFFNWCAGDSAQNILVNDAGLVSPFDDCQYEAVNPFYKSMNSYITAGNYSGWHTMLKKDGLQNETCNVFADYAKGKLDADGFVSTMAQVISAYYAQ